MTGIGWMNFIADWIWFTFLMYLLPMEIQYEPCICMFYAMVQLMIGRYRNNVLLIWDEIRLIILSHVWFIIGVLLVYKWNSIETMLWLILANGLAFLFSIIFARGSRIWFRNVFKKNVLVIGIGHTAERLQAVCRGNRFSLMDIKGFISCNKSDLLPHIYQQEQIVKGNIYPLDAIHEIIDKADIDAVLIAIPQIMRKDLELIIRQVRDQVQEIKVIPRFEGMVTFDSRVDDFDGLLMISSAQRVITIWARLGKRIMDIAGSIAGILILIPLYFYVRHRNHQSGDYGPVFFTQKRIGRKGKEFTIYKFRTMVMDADAKLEKLMQEDPAIREEYTKNKKLKHDPRITAAGEFLRKTSLDEFPQFINVLKGEMSLIGPRPYLPKEKEDMGELYDTVIKMKPGLTGMWQTHGRSDVDFQDRLAFDDYYYRNYNLWLDVTLLVKTISIIFSHKGQSAV